MVNEETHLEGHDVFKVFADTLPVKKRLIKLKHVVTKVNTKSKYTQRPIELLTKF